MYAGVYSTAALLEEIIYVSRLTVFMPFFFSLLNFVDVSVNTMISPEFVNGVVKSFKKLHVSARSFKNIMEIKMAGKKQQRN